MMRHEADDVSRLRRIIRRLTLVTAVVSVVAALILLPPLWQADDIREAVFRHLFAHNASGLQNHADAYYLSVGPFWFDPGEGFLKRFAGHKPPVRKFSECRPPDEFPGRPRNIKTGREGLIFRVRFIRRVGLQEFEVKGGYYEGFLSASGNTYRVRLMNGCWVVVRDRMDWISCLGMESPG